MDVSKNNVAYNFDEDKWDRIFNKPLSPIVKKYRKNNKPSNSKRRKTKGRGVDL